MIEIEFAIVEKKTFLGKDALTIMTLESGAGKDNWIYHASSILKKECNK